MYLDQRSRQVYISGITSSGPNCFSNEVLKSRFDRKFHVLRLFIGHYPLLRELTNQRRRRSKLRKETESKERNNLIRLNHLNQQPSRLNNPLLPSSPPTLQAESAPFSPTMLSRSVLAQQSTRALRQSQCTSQVSRRGLAAAASGSFGYETGEANGIKYASRDTPAPTTTLAVVAKAGTRYQPLPGLADGLEKFAFKVSKVNITREALCG